MICKRLSTITLADIVCYASNKLYLFTSRLIGTTFFRIKAFMFGVKVLGSVECYGSVHILRAPRSEISVGKNCIIVSATKRCTSSSIFAPTRLWTLSGSAKIIIGEGVGLNGTSIVARSRTVRIGNGTMIAPNVTIMDSDFHAQWPPENRLSGPSFENDSDVTIGTNVWICTQCIILKGVTIGNNSIIGAGTIVTKDIPSNVVAGGVPAKVIKRLGA